MRSERAHAPLLMLLFGVLSLALGAVQFRIPGIPGGISDLREAAVVIGTLYLPHWGWGLGVALITTLFAAAHQPRVQHDLQLEQAYEVTLEGWARALELRDRETEGHTRRVADLAVRLGRALGLGSRELVHLRRGAVLHDIGKMGVPDRILLKPGGADIEEMELLREHPEHARRMLEPVEFLRPTLDVPYGHHERWDGSGYPRGLAGEEIPLSARLFAVVDVWDALLSERPYRPAWSREQAVRHLRDGAGTLFDPRIVEVFLRDVVAADDHDIAAAPAAAVASPVSDTVPRRERAG